MRKFRDAFGHDIDLDDPKTYENLPDNVKELDDLMFREIGYAYTYMNHFHPDIFLKGRAGGQMERVEKLIYKFSIERKYNYENVKWYQETIYIFQDETENMC